MYDIICIYVLKSEGILKYVIFNGEVWTNEVIIYSQEKTQLLHDYTYNYIHETYVLFIFL